MHQLRAIEQYYPSIAVSKSGEALTVLFLNRKSGHFSYKIFTTNRYGPSIDKDGDRIVWTRKTTDDVHLHSFGHVRD